MQPVDSEPSARILTDLVASVHAEGLTGEVIVDVPEGQRRLYFVRGDLHLPSDHPLAGALRPILAELARDEGSVIGSSSAGVTAGVGTAKLRAVMTRIATLLDNWSRQGWATFHPAARSAGELVGPLPTALLLMEWAAEGDEEGLVERLGGESRWVSLVPRRSASAALAARLVDPHAAVLLSRLARPAMLGDLVRQSSTPRLAVLADVARLQAAGLVTLDETAVAATVMSPAAGPRPGAAASRGPGGVVDDGVSDGAEGASPLPSAQPADLPPSTGVIPRPASKDVVHRYAERIGRELEVRPLVLDTESHRSRLSDLLTRAGGLTAYELLEVDGTAPGPEVHEAFQRLARLAHPSHGERLDLAEGERPLWLLFEQAVSAYLALSQPERRRRYDDRLQGLATSSMPLPRPDERQQLARSYYERAEALLDAEDFHFAVELLKQAVHTHPRPEYYVLLGRAQAKNPNWLRHALHSYRKAVELGADDSPTSLALGRLCEAMENFAEARRHYEAALAKNPAEPDARAGLARLTSLEGASNEGPRSRWSIGSLFRKR